MYHHYKNGNAEQKDLVYQLMESIHRFANTTRDIARAATRFGTLLDIDTYENPLLGPVVAIETMMNLLGKLLQGIEIPSARIHLSRLQQFHFKAAQRISQLRRFTDNINMDNNDNDGVDEQIVVLVDEQMDVLVDLGSNLHFELQRIASLQDRLLASPPVRYNPYIIIRNPGPPTDDRGWLMVARRITEPEYEEVENDMAGLGIQEQINNE